MSFSLADYDAWVLQPYCFCKDREWLSIDGLKYIDIDDDGAVAALPGLDTDETALLAALLTALAIFLFLLFLLLCLLCPFGLCFGKKGLCCSKASRAKKSKTDAKAPSVSSSNSVNLTAVDMKIPRAWMDNYAGFSDSELDKKGKLADGGGWEDGGDSVHWWGYGGKYGHHNKGFQGDDFRDGGWFSTSDLDSIYGGGDRSVRGRKQWDGTTSGKGKGEMIAMDEFYRGSVKRRNTGDSSSTLRRYKSNSYSSIIEKLMTPHTTSDLCTHGNNGYYGDRDRAGGSGGHHDYASVGGYGSYGNGDRAIETVTMTKQEATRSIDVPISMMKTGANGNSMNAVAEITMTDARRGTELTNHAPPTSYYDSITRTSCPPYAESVATTTMTVGDKSGDYVRPVDIMGDPSSPYGVITEIKQAYTKRVVEETETVSSN